MLDIISGGRVEFGIGRGFQPRESETFGYLLGSSVQDQELNRAYYQEAYEVIIKAWTQPSFSHHGQFFSLPPVHTRWNHHSTLAYFSRPEAGRRLDEAMQLGDPDPFGGPVPVMQSSTVLRELQVFPQPLQKPHPQMWEPLLSERSVRWAARHGLNGFFFVETLARLKKFIATYFEEAEKRGWPDRLNRGRIKFGWDADKRRGILPGRFIHLLLPGMDRERELKRYKEALSILWDYFVPFGIPMLMVDEGEKEPQGKSGPDRLLEKEIAIFGTPDEVVATLMRLKETVGYDDFIVNVGFEAHGYEGREIEEQMQFFAEEVRPILARACGGQVKNPELGVALPDG